VKCKGTSFLAPREEALSKVKKIKLMFEDMPIKIESGDVVGREAKGDKLLALMTTVSRRHAQFFYENNKWYIEDLNSSNGSFLKSIKCKVQNRTEIEDGDILFLSRSVEMKIKI
jgi:hypothetical protein